MIPKWIEVEAKNPANQALAHRLTTMYVKVAIEDNV